MIIDATRHKKDNIVFLGAGNLGYHLSVALFEAGYINQFIYSRSPQSAARLGEKIGVPWSSEIDDISPDAGLYIISVPDEAIGEVTKKLGHVKGIVVHTSGSTEMNILKDVSKKIGVIYPMQTFSLHRSVSFTRVPFFIEGSNHRTMQYLRTLCSRLSENVIKMDSDQRRICHMAAVFASNFSNHMYAIASMILKQHKIDFALYRPLLEETLSKAMTNDPVKAQTGPAVRGDMQTMYKHLELINDDEKLYDIYTLVSHNIRRYKEELNSNQD